MVIKGSFHADVCSVYAERDGLATELLMRLHRGTTLVTGVGCKGHYNNQGEDIIRQKECSPG